MGEIVYKPKIRVKMEIGNNINNDSIFNKGTKELYEESNSIEKKNNFYHNYEYINNLESELQLHTVCREANCPNIRECWNKKHASFMIMGDICTRKCRFCNVKSGKPKHLDPKEPIRVAIAVSKMKLKHVVVTSVDRDDLDDGGANHFVETIHSIRSFSSETTIEVLTPDFLKKGDAYKKVIEAGPDVFNHNIETVPSLYRSIMPASNYFSSLMLLKRAKEEKPGIFTKSGIMVGLGETDEEVLTLMDDMRAAQVDFITIGQYLRPGEKYAPVKRYVNEESFDRYRKAAKRKGFLMISASALTRSSYHADEDFEKLRNCRKEMLMQNN